MNTFTACPLCKGTGGYYNKALVEHREHNLWNGHALLSERMHVVQRYKRRYCIDCGKYVSALLDAPTFKLE